MKKIERRAFVCLALALLLAAGLGFFLVKYFLDGGSWASSAFNRHLYNSSGQLASGTVLDRDGDVLSEVVDGQRTYYDNATVRKATLHAVGDLQGNIGTGALNAFADKLTGYSLLNGAFGAQRGNDLYLTIDARLQKIALDALKENVEAAQKEESYGSQCTGSVVVLDVNDFSVLCAQSYPNYDLDKYMNDPQYREDLLLNKDGQNAMWNRCFWQGYPIGSAMKPAVALAAFLAIVTNLKRTKKWHPIVFLGFSAVVGIVFHFAGV